MYKVTDIVVLYSPAKMTNEVVIKYMQDNSSLKSLTVEITDQMAQGAGSQQQIIALYAGKIAGPEFYDAVKHYFMYGYTDPNNPYKYKPYSAASPPFKSEFATVKGKPNMSYEELKKKIYATGGIVSNPAAEVSINKYSNHTQHIHVKPGKVYVGGYDEGLNMGEIDALPGIHETAVHPVTKEKMKIKDIIINLNDGHSWTREAVADWLETLDVDLTFKVPPAKLTEKEEKLAKLRKQLADVNDKITTLAGTLSETKVQAGKLFQEIQTLMEETDEQS